MAEFPQGLIEDCLTKSVKLLRFGDVRGNSSIISTGEKRMIDFVVHDEGDSVGVVVVEGVTAGDELTGWVMDQDTEIKFTAASDIPIGHKLAIKPLKEGDTVIKYGVDIGRVVADIGMGEHAHVHNIKTKRW
jgi:(2R)-sulfolactate sulfo-lyase subunit alpha